MLRRWVTECSAGTVCGYRIDNGVARILLNGKCPFERHGALLDGHMELQRVARRVCFCECDAARDGFVTSAEWVEWLMGFPEHWTQMDGTAEEALRHLVVCSSCGVTQPRRRAERCSRCGAMRAGLRG